MNQRAIILGFVSGACIVAGSIVFSFLQIAPSGRFNEDEWGPMHIAVAVLWGGAVISLWIALRLRPPGSPAFASPDSVDRPFEEPAKSPEA